MRALYVILGAYIFVHAHVSGVRVLSLPGPLRANAGNTAAMASRAPCDHHARQDSRINFGPCLQTRHLQKKAMASLGVEGATPVVTQLHATRAPPASCSRCHCMHTKKTPFVLPQAPQTATDTRYSTCLLAPMPPQAVAAQQGSAGHPLY